MDKLCKSNNYICIYSEDNMIYKVTGGFLKLTGYKYNDIVGKSLEELNILLKNNYQICFENIKSKENIYIFTKGNKPKDVWITCESLAEGKKIYSIIENEHTPLQWILYNFHNININKNESIAIYSYPDCLYLESNERYIENLKSMGLDTENIAGKAPEFPEYILEIINQDTSFYKNEIEFIGKDGLKTYWDINVRVILGTDGKKCLVVFFCDVTKKSLEIKSREKQRKEMKKILENVSDAVNILNNKGEYVYVNNQGKDKLSSYITEIDYVNDKKIFEILKFHNIDGKELLFEDIPSQKVLKGQTINEYVIVGTSEGPPTYYLCNGSPIYDELGNVEGGVLIYEDIGHKLKKGEYYVFKENIEDLFVSYAILSYNDFKIKYINETGFNGIKSSNSYLNSELELIGKNFFEFYENNDQELLEDIRNSVKEKNPFLHKQKFIKEGKEKYLRTIFRPIFDTEGQVQKIIAIGMDITEDELDKKEMANALKIQDEIFINISHELKTPLNLIFSASQLLNVYLESQSLEDIRENMIDSNKIIIKNCNRLTKLINNISDITKLESGFCELHLSNNDIVKVIEGIIHLISEYIEASGLKIIFTTEVEEMILAFDPYKIERVLLNLISNAIKFSKPNGFIKVGLVKKDSTVEIFVEDDGIGIETGKIDLIFEKFVQLNTSLNRISEGTGIGLALVKSMVELHDGNISVESTLGEGSIFKMELPIITVDGVEVKIDDNYKIDKSEMIKYELSDIYS